MRRRKRRRRRRMRKEEAAANEEEEEEAEWRRRGGGEREKKKKKKKKKTEEEDRKKKEEEERRRRRRRRKKEKERKKERKKKTEEEEEEEEEILNTYPTTARDTVASKDYTTKSSRSGFTKSPGVLSNPQSQPRTSRPANGRTRTAVTDTCQHHPPHNTERHRGDQFPSVGVQFTGTDRSSSPHHRLVGLVVKASASRAEGPGFESRWSRDFFGVESYQ